MGIPHLLGWGENRSLVRYRFGFDGLNSWGVPLVLRNYESFQRMIGCCQLLVITGLPTQWTAGCAGYVAI